MAHQLPVHEAELPAPEEGVHVGEGGGGHGRRVALVAAREQALAPADLEKEVSFFLAKRMDRRMDCPTEFLYIYIFLEKTRQRYPTSPSPIEVVA